MAYLRGNRFIRVAPESTTWATSVRWHVCRAGTSELSAKRALLVIREARLHYAETVSDFDFLDQLDREIARRARPRLDQTLQGLG